MDIKSKEDSTLKKAIEGGISPFSKKYWSINNPKKGIAGGLEYIYGMIQRVIKLPIVLMANVFHKFTSWFNKVKTMCDELGYASNIKDYKKNPENYKGNVADISTVIRVAVTTKSNTPDLYEILKLLGKEEILRRINLI